MAWRSLWTCRNERKLQQQQRRPTHRRTHILSNETIIIHNHYPHRQHRCLWVIFTVTQHSKWLFWYKQWWWVNCGKSGFVYYMESMRVFCDASDEWNFPLSHSIHSSDAFTSEFFVVHWNGLTGVTCRLHWVVFAWKPRASNYRKVDNLMNTCAGFIERAKKPSKRPSAHIDTNIQTHWRNKVLKRINSSTFSTNRARICNK